MYDALISQVIFGPISSKIGPHNDLILGPWHLTSDLEWAGIQGPFVEGFHVAESKEPGSFHSHSNS
jgi:hypothetical protein